MVKKGGAARYSNGLRKGYYDSTEITLLVVVEV